MYKPLITGCTFVRNEINFIEDRVCEYLPLFDNIIALDDSTDGTTDILRSYGATIIRQDITPWHASTVRNMLSEMVDTPWAWFFFPDEQLESTLSYSEIRELILSHTGIHNILYIKRWNEMGSEEEDGWKYPDWQANIIRSHIRYVKQYHEVPLYSSEEPLNGYLLDDEPIRLRHLKRPCDLIHRDTTKWERRLG